jgi:ribonuclease HI
MVLVIVRTEQHS